MELLKQLIENDSFLTTTGNLSESILIDIQLTDEKIENGIMIPNQFPNKVNDFDCVGLKKLTSLENSPQEANYFYCNETSITSLKGAPKIINDTFFCNSTKITSLEYAPLKCNTFFCKGNDIKSLQGIGRKYLKECETLILPDTIESNILGLCLINKLDSIIMYDSLADLIKLGPLYEVIEIVKKYLQTDGDECAEELRQAKYSNYAKF